MPQRTETGANVVACKVNGNVQRYSGRFSWNHPDGVSFGNYIADHYTFLKARSDKYNDHIGIVLYTFDIEVGKEYIVSREDAQDFAQYYTGSGTSANTYTTENGAGVVKFTRYDSIVAAGTFSFSAVNPSGEEVKITEGFFDVSRKE
jgi:hypothetical protein